MVFVRVTLVVSTLTPRTKRGSSSAGQASNLREHVSAATYIGSPVLMASIGTTNSKCVVHFEEDGHYSCTTLIYA